MSANDKADSVTGLSRRLTQSAHHTCLVQNGASFTVTGCVASSRNLKIDVVSCNAPSPQIVEVFRRKLEGGRKHIIL